MHNTIQQQTTIRRSEEEVDEVTSSSKIDIGTTGRPWSLISASSDNQQYLVVYQILQSKASKRKSRSILIVVTRNKDVESGKVIEDWFEIPVSAI